MKKMNVFTVLGLFVLSAEFNAAQAQYYESIFGYQAGQLHSSDSPSVGSIVKSYTQDGGTASAEISASPTPYVRTTAIASFEASIIPRIEARLGYDFTLSGTPNSVIPLNVISLYNVQLSNVYDLDFSPSVDIGLGIGVNGGNISYQVGCSSAKCGHLLNLDNSTQTQYILLDGYEIVQSELGYSYTDMQFENGNYKQNSVLQGLMLVNLDSNGFASGTVSLFSKSTGASLSEAYGYLDPYFYISPEYLSLNPNAAITFDLGVGNANPLVSAVPEPETYAMLLAGLGLIGFSARRKIIA